MSKLIPYRELQVKLASLEAADQWARKMAHWEAAARLVEGVGQSMAKEARLMGSAVKGVGKLMWKNKLPLAVLGAGAAAVGAVKAAPKVVRALEQTKNTPMAYGGGYSSVNYGYGAPSPYAMPRQPMGSS